MKLLSFSGMQTPLLQQHAEDPATVTSNSVEFKQQQESLNNITLKKRKRRRCVHFSDEIQVHENNMLCKEECRPLWYKPYELNKFRRQAKLDSATLRVVESLSSQDVDDKSRRYTTRMHSLARAYKCFCAASTPQDLERLLKSSSSLIAAPMKDVAALELLLGMEKRIHVVAQDSHVRRHHLVQAILHWQSVPMSDGRLRAEMIAELSRDMSRPSRMYGAHIGVLMAAC